MTDAVADARHVLDRTIEDLIYLVASEAAQTSAHEALGDRLVRDYQQAVEMCITDYEDAVEGRGYAAGVREVEESL